MLFQSVTVEWKCQKRTATSVFLSRMIEEFSIAVYILCTFRGGCLWEMMDESKDSSNQWARYWVMEVPTNEDAVCDTDEKFLQELTGSLTYG